MTNNERIDLLRSYRADRGLSQREMAAQMGVTEGRTVRRWENGECPIPKWVPIMLNAFKALEGASKVAQVGINQAMGE